MKCKLVNYLFIIIILNNILTISALNWLEFKEKYGKSYISSEEETARYKIFLKNLNKIKLHNQKFENGEKSYKLAMNKFGDLTRDEFAEKYGTINEINTNFANKNYGNIDDFNDDDLPENFDWRNVGAVTMVREQGDCYGASIAISVTGSIEGRAYIKHNKSILLSPQCLLDCARLFGDFSCISYDATEAFDYIESQGIASEENYPYVGNVENVTCNMNMFIREDVDVTGHVDVYPREKFFKRDLVNYGPIVVRIGTDPIQLYSSGIFQDECYNEYISVAGGMLLVGYGTENDTDFWILRNSWGTSWGEDGYIRLARNGDEGLCGIYTNAQYPYVK